MEFASFEKMKEPGHRDVRMAIGLHQDRWSKEVWRGDSGVHDGLYFSLDGCASCVAWTMAVYRKISVQKPNIVWHEASH